MVGCNRRQKQLQQGQHLKERCKLWAPTWQKEVGWAPEAGYQQGSFSTPVAKPPAGSSLLFGALADSGRIKQRKNGSYRMVLKGIDDIDWFTDRPDRVAGEWSPKKLVKKWDGLFGGVEPNAQATFEMGSKRKLVTFEMFKPKLGDSNQTLSFKVRGIGKKNKDLMTGLRNKRLSDASLFIDDSLPPCLPYCEGVDLSNADLSNADLRYAKLRLAILPNANLSNADLSFANLYRAELPNANLSNVYLSRANLGNADLSGADLTDANLSNAKLNGARWFDTTCPDGTTNDGTSPCTAEQLNLA